MIIMKSVTFARLVLFTPYLTLIESVGYFITQNYKLEDAPTIQVFNEVWNFFALFWVIPYTILTVYLLIWSLRKTKEQIQATYTCAPILMAFISPSTYIILLIIGFFLDHNFLKGLGQILVVAMFVSIPASLIIGFIAVGFFLLIYKFLEEFKIIKD